MLKMQCWSELIRTNILYMRITNSGVVDYTRRTRFFFSYKILMQLVRLHFLPIVRYWLSVCYCNSLRAEMSSAKFNRICWWNCLTCARMISGISYCVHCALVPVSHTYTAQNGFSTDRERRRCRDVCLLSITYEWWWYNSVESTFSSFFSSIVFLLGDWLSSVLLSLLCFVAEYSATQFDRLLAVGLFETLSYGPLRFIW